MMNHKRMLALGLAAAMTLSLLAVSADVVEPGGETPDVTQSVPPILIAPNPNVSAPSQDIAAEDAPAPEQSEAAPEQDGAAPEQGGAQAEESVLAFADLEQLVLTGSTDALMLGEHIAFAEAVDYDKAMEDLREGLNKIANAQWQLSGGGSSGGSGSGGAGGFDPTAAFSDPGQKAVIGGIYSALGTMQTAIQGMAAMSTSSAAQALDAQYDALREQYDNIKEGKTQKEAADGIRSLRDTQKNIVMMAQALYVQMLEAQAGGEAMNRGLAAMDRAVEELELRYEMGQISALTLQTLKAQRSSLVSQQTSLQNSIQTGLMNLENLTGQPLTGEVKLGEVPKVSPEELAAMDLEADLTKARENSFTLYNAKKTLDDAEEVFEEAGDEYNHNTKKYQYVQAQHTWQAAQYTYEGVQRSFELAFRTLYGQVKDYQQVLEASKTALALELDNYAVDQLKYEQGTISHNALLTAGDDLATAQAAVATAERNLFSSYNTYRWAVDHGILN